MTANAIEVYQASPTGLKISQSITFDEWAAIGGRFGTALQTAAWCIGDWMVYGERKWGHQLIFDGEEFNPKLPARIPSAAFEMAVASTGLDWQTLSVYASVCRKIPLAERKIRLTFGHHRILAPLPPPQRLEWLSLFDSESNSVPTVKRLALSVRMAGDGPARIVTDEEIMAQAEASGHDNYIPHLMRLVTILRKTIPAMDARQRMALKQDLADLYELVAKI
jgi:hypothetical protein